MLDLDELIGQALFLMTDDEVLHCLLIQQKVPYLLVRCNENLNLDINLF